MEQVAYVLDWRRSRSILSLMLADYADLIQQIGFGVLAAVPDSGQVYPLLGRPHDSLLPPQGNDGYNLSFCTYVGATFDASTTNLTYHIPAPALTKSAKPLEVVLSFLSPITPTSTLRQSIPASYFTVHVSGNFAVNIYVDVNGQWVSADRGATVTWDMAQQDLGHGKGLKTWRVKKETEALLSEDRDRAEWGTLHFSAPSVNLSCPLVRLLANKH